MIGNGLHPDNAAGSKWVEQGFQPLRQKYGSKRLSR